MQFAGINYLAVIVAALAGFGVGAVWYMALAQPWMDAVGMTEVDRPKTPKPFIIAGISLLIMAYMLAGVIAHLGEVSLGRGILAGIAVWFGFVLTTMAVNHGFQGARLSLTVIDGGHWLAVLIVMGAIIGLFGI